MTPDFSPEPTGLPMVPVTLAAVGEAMLRVAGQVADGVRLHPLCSRRYLEEVCLPQIAIGMQRGGRDARELRRARRRLCRHRPGRGDGGRRQWRPCGRRIGFYGSTRTYLPILALHGLEELGQKLHRMSVEGRWDGMAAEVPDDVVRIFAACGTYAGIAQRDRTALSVGWRTRSIWTFRPARRLGLRRELFADIRRIPHRFAGFATNW